MVLTISPHAGEVQVPSINHATAAVDADLAEGGARAPQFAEKLRAEERRRRLRRLGARLFLGGGVPLVGLCVWTFLSNQGHLHPIFFPTPIEVLHSMGEELLNAKGFSRVSNDLGHTMREVGLAFGLGGISGLLFGVWMGVSRRAFFALGPLMYAAYPLPKIVLYPIALTIFGLGSKSTVALAALGVFYTVAISTLSGIKSSDQVYSEVRQVFSVRKSVYYTKIVCPAAWPSVMTGVRISIGECLLTVIAIEFISSTNGIGVYIWQSWEQLNAGRLFVGLTIVGITGGVLVVLGNLCERWTSPWMQSR